MNVGNTDPVLGQRIKDKLVKLGFENPLLEGTVEPWQHEGAITAIRSGIANGLTHLGIDLDDPSMQNTPSRYAEMFVNELTRGLNYENFPKCTATPNGKKIPSINSSWPTLIGRHDQMVLVDHIEVMSLCEHHLQTIDGFAHIAYIPGTQLLGLSKFARVVDFFSRRPQVQERLTDQIFYALELVLETDDIAVVISAKHYCMKARGSQQHASTTTTNKMGGRFMTKPALREELFNAISRSAYHT